MLYSEVEDFKIVSNFCIHHFFKLKIFCSPNCRYNGSYASVCANEL